MSEVLIEGITNVTIANGLVRIDRVAVGPNNQRRPSGNALHDRDKRLCGLGVSGQTRKAKVNQRSLD